MEPFTGLTSNSRARVEVTLELQITDNWNGQATVEQVHAQAKESALGKLRDLTSGGRARVIGEPKVTMILVDAKQ